MTEYLIKFIKSVTDLPGAEEEKFLKLLKPLSISKGEYYIREGQTPKKFGFVSKGLFRYLYIDKRGNEFTKSFITEGNFVAAYSAMISEKPSKMFIHALEESCILEINYTNWLELKQGNACWNSFLVAILERAFSIKETRERELLLLDALERYDIFKNEFPDLENRVKQHLIASYLGISPISLSRLKNKSTR